MLPFWPWDEGHITRVIMLVRQYGFLYLGTEDTAWFPKLLAYLDTHGQVGEAILRELEEDRIHMFWLESITHNRLNDVREDLTVTC